VEFYNFVFFQKTGASQNLNGDSHNNENNAKQKDELEDNGSASVLYPFSYFFVILCKITTPNDQILGFIEHENMQR